MKPFKFLICAALCLIAVYAFPVRAAAEMGDMGFFGGISEGRRLPSTMEQLLVRTAAGGQNNRLTCNYKEIIFLGGRPRVFEGQITIAVNGGVEENTASGAYTVNYRVNPVAGAVPGDGGVTITRTANYNVTYRVEGTQVIHNFNITPNNWSENITTPDGAFVLDARLSHYNISVIEDRTPGVSYYRGDVSGRMVYNSANNPTTAEYTGSFYGYNCAWSSTETHRMDITVMNDEFALSCQVRPSVTVNKVLQYTQNEPSAISFEGNYKEVMQNFGGLRYDIFIKPNFAWDEPDYGTVSISTPNFFEQLPAPDLSFLKGNAAEDDIARLFAMQIITGDPNYYVPSQAMTRGQFVTALAKAIKLPIDESVRGPTVRGRPSIAILFSDVDSTRLEFPYVEAITKAGIAHGRQNGSFDFDSPIQLQEAVVMMVRGLGLTQVAPNPTPMTRFADDAQVSDWAKREMAAADRLGFIAPDQTGRIYPTRLITKGEAAALFNQLLEYMRNGLVSQYAEQIVNIPR